MEWLKRMRDSIEYIEKHLESKIDMDEIAAIAHSSKFHYQRMFHVLTGVTVAEYIRKRRLTLSAQELASSSSKVIDIALKYGYDTPESFSKAFRKFHGISPSKTREPMINLKSFGPLSFQISLKGDKDMNYKIVEKEGFRIIGKGIRVSTVNDENFRRIPKFWDESNQNGLVQKLIPLAEELGLLGVCMDYTPDLNELTYFIGAVNTKDYIPEGFDEKEIPASTWAVFESIGSMPDAIQDVWKRIFSEWFPGTGYEHANSPELEVYPPGDPNGEEYRSEVWIPIIKKR